jgi:peptide/nickel transport system permease protein
MGLREYVVKRLAYSVILLLLVLTVNFFLFMVMPGNPVDLFVPSRGITKEQYERLVQAFKHKWGLDQPVYIQYFTYIVRMLTWDFGTSMYKGTPVADEIMYRIPWTLLLVGVATTLSIIIGVVLGVVAAHKRGSAVDTGLLITSLITGSLPTFWIGLVLITIFSISLRLLPAGHIFPPEWGIGNTPFPQAYKVNILNNGTSISCVIAFDFSGTLTLLSGFISHAILPVSTLTIFLFGGYTLLARATMLESLTEDYIVTARAKGLDDRKVLFKHALKNASLPIITSVALSFGFLFSGATITETVFSWEGLGRWIYEAVEVGDYFAMQAIFYIIALCVIIANIIADLLYGVVDPRIKYGW